jgi:hypothetical protein
MFQKREKLLPLPRFEPRIFQPIVIYDVYAIQVHFKIQHSEIRGAGVEGIHMAQDNFKRRGLVNTVRNLRAS